MSGQAKRCDGCGAKNRADWRACQRCRRPLTAPAAREAAATTPSGRSMWLAAGGLGIGSMLAIALWGRPTAPVAVEPAAARPATRGAAAVFDQPTQPTTAQVARTPITREDYARAGEAAYAQGQMTVALSAFEAAVAAFPGDPDASNNLGQLLTRVGRAADAIPHLEAAVAADPGKWAYRFNLARARGMAGDWEGAVADYRQALALFPDDHATLYNLGRALQKAGHDAEAVAPLERAVVLQPRESSLLLTLAACYEKLSRLPDAVRAYRSFLELEPLATDAPAIRARITKLEEVSRPTGSVVPTSDAPPEG